jgi:MFS family permease
MIRVAQMEPVRPYRRRLAALSLAMLLPSLGTSIANVALPSLSASFGASFQDVRWVVIAYLLAVTGLIVLAGRLGDMLGRRRLLLDGIATFALASAGGALAPSLWALILARAVQGAGAAVMMVLAVALVGDMVPKERTGSAMGLLGTVSAVGTALGPSLGGALVACCGWQAVFAFMAATGAIAFLACRGMLLADAPEARSRSSLDAAGTALLALAITAYALATTLGGVNGGLFAIIAAGAGIAFVVAEARATSPIVQVQLLRDRGFIAGLAAMGLVSAIVMTTLVVGPFYLADALGLAPMHAGLAMSVGPAIAALAGVPAGRLVDRLGASAVTFAGLAVVMLGSCLMTVLPGAAGVGGYVASLGLITAGYALFQAANNTTVMNGAARDRRGVTAALLALFRNLGLITGASAIGGLFALGSRGVAMAGLGPGSEAGMQVAFAAAAALAGLALLLAWWGQAPRRSVLSAPAADRAESAPGAAAAITERRR